MNKKELKKISKKNICGTFTANQKFAKDFNRITGERATYNKIKEIRNIIDKEIDNEVITTEEKVLQRGYELIHENYIIGGKLQSEEKEIKPVKNKYRIELPYINSGLMVGYGKEAFGGVGGIATKMGEGSTKWRFHKCYVKENGLSIEETGDFIRFDKIKSINQGEEEGMLLKHINVCLELKNDKTFSFRIMSEDLSLLEIIEDNIIPEDNITPENNNTVANNNSGLDELLKAKELLEAGLLTKTEFNELKSKILNNI